MPTLTTPDIMNKIRGKLYNVGFASISRAPDRTNTLLVDGVRVAVKVCSPNARGKWKVSLHRHGKLDESATDAYLICLLDVPGNSSMPLYLIFRAPVGRSGFAFTFSSLTRIYAANIEAWAVITEARTKAA